MTKLPFSTFGDADFKIQQNISITKQAQFNTITYGNTIQNIPRGINNVEETYGITMAPLTQTELETMDAFYELHTGQFGVLPSAFDFTPLNETVAQRFVFSSGLSTSQLSGTIKSISFTIRRVFNE